MGIGRGSYALDDGVIGRFDMERCKFVRGTGLRYMKELTYPGIVAVTVSVRTEC